MLVERKYTIDEYNDIVNGAFFQQRLFRKAFEKSGDRVCNKLDEYYLSVYFDMRKYASVEPEDIDGFRIIGDICVLMTEDEYEAAKRCKDYAAVARAQELYFDETYILLEKCDASWKDKCETLYQKFKEYLNSDSAGDDGEKSVDHFCELCNCSWEVLYAVLKNKGEKNLLLFE